MPIAGSGQFVSLVCDIEFLLELRAETRSDLISTAALARFYERDCQAQTSP